MKKIGISGLILLSSFTQSIIALEAQQCALDSTCSFTIRGKFNKEFITPRISKKQNYICSLFTGKGSLLSINSVFASPGIRYELKGLRFNRPFIIHGAPNEMGYIRYTLTSHNDPWRKDTFQFSCKPIVQ